MGYVNYNQAIHRVGFRPYGLTNPWAATQLSGVASGEGLGQNHPFSASGGWHLHGLGEDLGNVVPDQSIVTYRGKWSPSTHGAQALVSAVSQALGADGLSVRSATSDAGFVQNTDIPFVYSTQPFNVILQIQVENGMGYGDPNDIVSIVRHEVFAASGQMPLSDSISSVQAPGGVPTPTGQTPSPADSSFAAEDWNTWLQENATSILLTVAGVALLPTILRRLI